MGACCSAEHREGLMASMKKYQQQVTSTSSGTDQSYQQENLPPIQKPPLSKNQSILFTAGIENSNNSNPLNQQSYQMLTQQQQQQLQSLQQQQYVQQIIQQQQQLSPQQVQQQINYQNQQQQYDQQLLLGQNQYLQNPNQYMQPSLLYAHQLNHSNSQPQFQSPAAFQLNSPEQLKQIQELEKEKLKLEEEKKRMARKAKDFHRIESVLRIKETLKRSKQGTPYATSNQSPQSELNTSLSNNINQQNRQFPILDKLKEEIQEQYKKDFKSGLYQQFIQNSENQLREDHKYFEGYYLMGEEDKTNKQLKIFIKIDDETNQVSGFYHDKTLEYQVYGFIDPQSKQIIIGLIKRPLLILVGQYDQNFYKIQGYTMDQEIINDPQDWWETILILKNN